MTKAKIENLAFVRVGRKGVWFFADIPPCAFIPEHATAVDRACGRYLRAYGVCDNPCRSYILYTVCIFSIFTIIIIIIMVEFHYRPIPSSI